MKLSNRQSFLKISPSNKLKKWFSRKLTRLIMSIIIALIVIALFNHVLSIVIKTMNLPKFFSSQKDSTIKPNEREIINVGIKTVYSSSISEFASELAFFSTVSTTTTITSENVDKEIMYNMNNGKVTEEKSNSDEIRVENNLQFPEDAHPLENLCKYPILQPWDDSIMDYMIDYSDMTCNQVLPDIINFQNGKISVDQENATKELNFTVDCKYRPLGGTLWPAKNTPVPIGEWVNITEDELNVWDDQIEVQCFEQNGNESHLVYRFAFAHVVPKFNKTFAVNTEDRLSLNIVEMDSVSRNAFRRHMPLSFEYLTKDLKAIDFQGFVKVADNTLPNLLPILAGLRYLNLSDDMPSDLPLGKQLDVDAIPMLWKEYQDKGCATMLNVDPVVAGFGFLQYPTPEFNGFHSWPTDYWFRPFYIFNRKYLVGFSHRNVSKLCNGNKFGFDYQLEFHKQMSMIYNNTCHFTFTSIAELGHDDCSRLELMDLKLKQLVERLHNLNSLNKTVLIIMGDHGQRVNLIRHEFIGRIEERMPLFTIVFPEWFRKKYPEIMKNLRFNQNRLISNFDIYHILKDVSDANFDGTQVNPRFPRQLKGLSPLHNIISKNRTCQEALIPENHCACLIPHKQIVPNDPINEQAYDLIKNYTQNTLKNFTECQPVEDIKMINITRWTLNQMVQHGIRLIEKDQLKTLKTNIMGNVEYVEVEYIILPLNISALIRIQNDIKNKLFFINSDPPLVLNGKFGCKDKFHLPSFCKCIE